MKKKLPLIVVLVALALGINYLRQTEIAEVTDEVQSGQAAPEHKSEIPF